MSDRELSTVRDAWRRWRDAVAERRAEGTVNASAEEVSSLEELVELLEKLPLHLRSRWLEENEEVGESLVTGLCVCGHHGEHHVDGGSCYHPSGCATICDCSRFQPARETVSISF